VTWPDGRQGYLKAVQCANIWANAELLHETAVLCWLAGQPFAPAVIFADVDIQRRYLLTQALSGTMSHELASQGMQVAHALGVALRQLHAIPTADCPFQQTLDVKLMIAQQHIAAGLIDVADFEGDTQQRTPEELWAHLDAQRPLPEDRAFTHGDYCLPNILLDPATFQVTGFVDWGRAGVADRYHDLGIAVRSIRRNLGPECVAPFFAAYGISTVDWGKVDYYIQLDELF
jgi:aminoglycoside phosphotransferase